ncbi:MAG: hypothetical protein MMC33_005564 [Icmadophila ericetorum]|nr:hypothetical protein [Icmadophila ericetorum]
MPVSGPLAKFPIGFNPEEASVEELEKYCYPPCPDPTSAPNHYAIWAGFASRRPQFVSPDFIEQPLDTGLDEIGTGLGLSCLSAPRTIKRVVASKKSQDHGSLPRPVRFIMQTAPLRMAPTGFGTGLDWTDGKINSLLKSD